VSDTATNLDHLDAQQLREMVQSLMGRVEAGELEIDRRDREIAFKQATIDKLTHEMAVLKRLKFASKSEAFTTEQRNLLEDTLDADLVAMELELELELESVDGGHALPDEDLAERENRDESAGSDLQPQASNQDPRRKHPDCRDEVVGADSRLVETAENSGRN
jgi:hypothetical protein